MKPQKMVSTCCFFQYNVLNCIGKFQLIVGGVNHGTFRSSEFIYDHEPGKKDTQARFLCETRPHVPRIPVYQAVEYDILIDLKTRPSTKPSKSLCDSKLNLNLYALELVFLAYVVFYNPAFPNDKKIIGEIFKFAYSRNFV